MSDDFDPAQHPGVIGAVVAAVTAGLTAVWRWWSKREERREARLLKLLEQLRTEQIQKLEKDLFEMRGAIEEIRRELPNLATKERVNGVANDHAEKLHRLDRWLTKVDTRQRDAMGIADSPEVPTSGGFRLGAKAAAFVAKKLAEEDDSE